MVCPAAGLDGEDSDVLRRLHRQACVRVVGLVPLQPATRLRLHRARLLRPQPRPRRQTVSHLSCVVMFNYETQVMA